MTAATVTRTRMSPGGTAIKEPPAARPGQPGRPVIAAMLTALVLSGAAALPLLRIFGTPGLRLIALVIPAAGVATAGARAGLGRIARDPRSPLPVAGGFVAGLVAGAAPGMLLAAADPFGPAALGPRLADAVTDGWRRLLSVPVPVPDTRSFSDLPVLLAASLAALLMLIALSDRPAAALVPATLGFGGLLTLGVHGPGSGILLSAAYALAALFFLAFGARSAGHRDAAAAVLSATAVIAAAALAVVAVHPGAPYDPRAALRLPLNTRVSQDPLALLSARLETPGVPVLTARLSGALRSHPRNWVVLGYDNYDGAGWQAAGSARPAATGTGVPGAVGSGTAAVTTAAPVALLPHPSYVLASVPEDLGYDLGTEMLAAPGAVTRYSVKVSIAEASVAALSRAAVPADSPAALTRVPSCVPAALRRLAAQTKLQVSAPDEQAVRLQQLLKSAPFRYDQAAPPGEGCGSISRLLTDHHGTSAQFATAFALAARMMGIPARVAVGYLPGKLVGSTETVTDADAYAWPQVLLTGVGWVDFDPTPTAGSSAASPAREKQPALKKIRVRISRGAKAEAGPSVVGPPSAAPAGGPGVLTWALLAAAAMAALALAWVAAVFTGSRWRRRRRRRAAEPAARVLGAWDELLIPLEQAGTPVRGRSAPRVAAAAAAVVPGEAYSVGQLAVLAERALYDEIDEHDATAAWQLSDRTRMVAAAAAGRRVRLRRLFAPPARRR